MTRTVIPSRDTDCDIISLPPTFFTARTVTTLFSHSGRVIRALFFSGAATGVPFTSTIYHVAPSTGDHVKSLIVSVTAVIVRALGTGRTS